MHRDVTDHSVHRLTVCVQLKFTLPSPAVAILKLATKIARVLAGYLILLPLLFGVFHGQRLQSNKQGVSALNKLYGF